jgi:hypothetical protein
LGWLGGLFGKGHDCGGWFGILGKVLGGGHGFGRGHLFGHGFFGHDGHFGCFRLHVGLGDGRGGGGHGLGHGLGGWQSGRAGEGVPGQQHKEGHGGHPCRVTQEEVASSQKIEQALPQISQRGGGLACLLALGGPAGGHHIRHPGFGQDKALGQGNGGQVAQQGNRAAQTLDFPGDLRVSGQGHFDQPLLLAIHFPVDVGREEFLVNLGSGM